MAMSFDEFLKRNPDLSFALYRVEVGPESNRRLEWKLSFDPGYYTSDSRRHVLPCTESEGFLDADLGAVLELATYRDLRHAERSVALYEKNLAEAREQLAAIRARLESMDPG